MVRVMAPWAAPVTGYDPRVDGADCDHCPMRRWAGVAWKPIRNKLAVCPDGLLLGEAPAAEEERRGEPFRGESGQELDRALQAVGIRRAAWDVANVIGCRAPANKYDLIGIKLGREQKAGTARPWERHPAEHCRPRLDAVLARNRNVVPLGGKALSAILGGSRSILASRGGPVVMMRVPGSTAPGGLHFPSPDDARTPAQQAGDPNAVRILPTVHPAFVRRRRRWRKVFVRDLDRAMRFFAGRLEWVDPLAHYVPTAQALADFLSQPSRFWTYDLETTRAASPTEATLLSLAICRDATSAEQTWARNAGHGEIPDACVVVPFGTIEPSLYGDHPWREWYADADLAAIIGILARAFTDGRTWIGHNAGYFDRLVLEASLGIRPAPLDDTVLLHRLVESELPHSLGLVGSLYTDVHAWKMDNEGKKLATDARTNAELWRYNALDTAVNHRVYPVLRAAVHARGQDRPCPARPSITLDRLDHVMQDVCVGMHRLGVHIDQDVREALEQDREKKLVARRTALQAAATAAGWPVASPINPASPQQIARLLYDPAYLDLHPIGFTETGDPSTKDEYLREHIMDPTITGHARTVLEALRDFRSVHKALTSFLYKLRLRTDPRGRGCVDADGRLRVHWSAHVPVSGRFSSGDPMNLQNWPKWLRACVVPEPGHVLVGCDFDAVEGKLGAGRWGLTAYLAAFAEGLDAHQITMEFCFGDRIWSMAGAPPPDWRYRKTWPAHVGSDGVSYPAGEIGGKFAETRTLTKRYYYAKQYKASDDVVLSLLREATDDDGNFVYANLTLAQVQAMSRRFLAACPEIEAGWRGEIARYRARGYNDEPFTGRRRDFLDGEDANEIINFPIQASAAALVNIATLDVVTKYPAFFAGPGTGIIQQGHDALLLEVPIEIAEQVRQDVEAAFTQHYPDIMDVEITGSAKIASSWKDV